MTLDGFISGGRGGVVFYDAVSDTLLKMDTHTYNKYIFCLKFLYLNKGWADTQIMSISYQMSELYIA
jgi:hypothetical protein